MAVGVETRIMEALFTHLRTIELDPPLAVAWPNIDFKPVAGSGYLRPSVLPALTTQASLGDAGYNRYDGIFQIDVFWPIGRGATQPREVASRVAEHFKRGTVLEREGILVRIDGPPSLGPMLQESAWIQLPVSVPYTVDAPN